MSAPASVGVVGLGYWGPNLARNFHVLPQAELRWCCDMSRPARERAALMFPESRMTDRFEDLLEDDQLDAIVLATPVPTHAKLTTRVLEAGKHCFVEKPLAQSVADAEQTVATAERAERTLMVGHVFIYHPAIRKLKELTDAGNLGEVRCIYSSRLNLGKLRADENALWSLGPHDMSILLDIVGEEPYELSARGECYLRPGVEDVVFCFMRFPCGIAAHLHLSWLDPRRERLFTVVGSRRMATFDDLASEGKITLYDKGFDVDARTYGEYIARNGDIFLPSLPSAEPLRLECEHFLDAIQTGVPPRSDGRNGLQVVRMLEKLQNDLERSRRTGAPGDRPADGLVPQIRPRSPEVGTRPPETEPSSPEVGARPPVHSTAEPPSGVAVEGR
jgi:predicted dehydrogenase